MVWALPVSVEFGKPGGGVSSDGDIDGFAILIEYLSIDSRTRADGYDNCS